jgi:ubiquinone/menaquinone biosynthesis C-methylase UbiE
MNRVSTFDAIAEEYDEDFTTSVTGKIQKEIVRKFICKSLEENDRNILEINCGTGDDAIYFSNEGFNIIATDISQGMINECEKKNTKYNLSNIRFLRSAFSELTEKLPEEKFDVIISNFGGLNCIRRNEIIKLQSDLYKLLNKNGKLFICLMGKFCLWESIYFLYKTDLKNSFRRMNGNAEGKFFNDRFKVYYYSPSYIKKLFKENFEFQALHPVGILTPPTYLENYFKKKRRTLKYLSKIENGFSAISILSNFSDHYLIEFRRRN